EHRLPARLAARRRGGAGGGDGDRAAAPRVRARERRDGVDTGERRRAPGAGARGRGRPPARLGAEPGGVESGPGGGGGADPDRSRCAARGGRVAGGPGGAPAGRAHRALRPARGRGGRAHPRHARGEGGGVKIWLDGRVVDAGEARIPVTDHGLLYGDGVFEGIRAFGRRVFRLDDHLARLRVSAAAIGMTPPLDEAGLREVVLASLRALGRDDAYVRLVLTRGEGALGVDPTSCPTPRVFCIAAEAAIFPVAKLTAGLDLVTVSWRRPAPDAIDPRVKSLNYLNNALAKLE